VKDVAEHAELNVSTTHHLVNTLEAAGYVYRTPAGQCRLGLAVTKLYGAFLQHFQPDAHLLEVLDELARETRETTYINTWQNGEIVVQAIHESPQALRIGGLYVGFRGAAHARAGGKALLAFLSPAELDRYLAQHPPHQVTAHTIWEAGPLREHLVQIAAQGYALDREEFAEGVCCVAVPVFKGDDRAVAALSVSVPAARFYANEVRFIDIVLSAARLASARLGHRSRSTTRTDGHRPPRPLAAN
jgi:DNA-binding IclR family transcriptional regulator